MIHFCTEQQTLQALEENWLNSSWSHFARNPNAMIRRLIRRQSESTLVNPVLFYTSGGFTVHSYNNTRGKAQHKYRSFRQRSAYATVAQR